MVTALAAGGAAAQTPPAAAPASAAAAPAAPTVTPLVGNAAFISPAGEPMRSSDALSGAEHWFRRADADGDGRITLAEFRADFDRFFQTLDTDHDGEIGPEEIDHYETVVAPEIRVSSTYGDPNLAKTDDDGKVVDPPYPTRLGAGRFGYLDMPEPVVAADANMDRSIRRQEFQQAADRRFKMLDVNGDGAITRDELPKLGAIRRENAPTGGRYRGGGHGHRGGGGGGFGRSGGGG